MKGSVGTLPSVDALAQMRPVLMKFAQMRLRNDAWAEDVVSETLVAALEQSTGFEARSQFQTWVIGILKHKIIDTQRKRQREISIDAHIEPDGPDDFDGLVQRDSMHLAAPVESSHPESIAAQRQFFQLMQSWIDRLPPASAQAFVMRAWFEYSTEEVCAALSISRSNCNVMMFRTRSRLRASIEGHDGGRPRSAPSARVTAAVSARALCA